VLDENGVVTAKYFEQSYRVRPTAALFREFVLGAPSERPPASTHAALDLKVRAWADTASYRPYQQQRLHVQLELPPGTHVFASPVPDGYAALDVSIEPLDGLTVGPMETTAAQEPLDVTGVDDELMVYAGSPLVTLPLLFTKNLGQTPLQVKVTFQSCTETICYPPRTAQLNVSLEGFDLIRD
jgi:hypothetical protein